jgi:capsular polysaccharide biosynthesis protein
LIQSKDQLLLINRLTLLPDLSPTGNYRKDIVLSIRDRFRTRFSRCSNDSAIYGKVYITRKNAKSRKIINEDELIPILLEANFKIVDMDLIGLKEQIEIMCDASMLISLHGAGLTHMLWMKKSASVFEIRAIDDSTNNCYFSLASDLGLDYYYALANKINTLHSTQQADYFIDINHFKEKLSHFLSRQNSIL